MKECCKNECSEHECCHKHESCNKKEHDECKTDFFLEVADCAWKEALKEAIKEHILATQGDRMKELAKILAEGNGKRWQSKMENKRACKEFQEQLCQFFGQKKK